MDSGAGDGEAPDRSRLDEASVRRELVTLLPRLRRFALSIAGARQDADDLLHTALERALARLHQYRPGTRLDSWMYRIIQNTRIDQARATSARPGTLSMDDVREAEVPRVADGGPEARITLEQTLDALQGLSEDHRAVLVLVCVEGLRYREAAEVLGVSVGTVMSRLARARQRLHRIVHGDAEIDRGEAR